jgi:putative DNA methylase
MAWDFAESNPFSDQTGNFYRQFELVARVLDALPPVRSAAVVTQLDARAERSGSVCVATDPPYYDNIGYADLSDFFYLWLRRGLKDIYPSLFSTLLTPKSDELVASPRLTDEPGGPARAFERGLRKAFDSFRAIQSPGLPLTLYYAFKQSEADTDGVASTGWETMLNALGGSGFVVTGTWPVRTERIGRPRDFESNALASSVVLVCRPRPETAGVSTRRAFLSELKAELPAALHELQRANIAPVDVAQAAIGPGIAIFGRYSSVLEADGASMTVRTALALINQTLDEILAEQEGDFDPDTRWAIAWFEQYGTNEGPYGVAETLSKAKNSALNGLVQAGIVVSKAGKVRLLDREELDAAWDPVADRHRTVWEVSQHLIRALDDQGEAGAALLLRRVGLGLGDVGRELAYRLYSICERKKWSREALAYNSLVIAWPEIVRLASEDVDHESATLGI